MEERRSAARPVQGGSHNVILENRKKLSVSGVKDVLNFDEESVSLMTDCGKVTVKGSLLHVNKLSLETGEVTVEGRVDSLLYSDEEGKREGESLLRRMFG